MLRGVRASLAIPRENKCFQGIFPVCPKGQQEGWALLGGRTSVTLWGIALLGRPVRQDTQDAGTQPPRGRRALPWPPAASCRRCPSQRSARPPPPPKPQLGQRGLEFLKDTRLEMRLFLEKVVFIGTAVTTRHGDVEPHGTPVMGATVSRGECSQQSGGLCLRIRRARTRELESKASK